MVVLKPFQKKLTPAQKKLLHLTTRTVYGSCCAKQTTPCKYDTRFCAHLAKEVFCLFFNEDSPRDDDPRWDVLFFRKNMYFRYIGKLTEKESKVQEAAD